MFTHEGIAALVEAVMEMFRVGDADSTESTTFERAF